MNPFAGTKKFASSDSGSAFAGTKNWGSTDTDVPPYAALATRFLNSSNECVRPNLLSIGDDGKFTMSFWFYLPALVAGHQVSFIAHDFGNLSVGVVPNLGDTLTAECKNGAGLNRKYHLDGVSAATWHHFAWSVNIGAGQTTRIRLDDSAVGFGNDTSGDSGPRNFNNWNSSIILHDVSTAGYNSFECWMADFWMCRAALNIDDPDIMAKFRNPTTGKPVDLGANGELVLGFAPPVFYAGAGEGFLINKGTDGVNLTRSGAALTASSTSPSD